MVANLAVFNQYQCMLKRSFFAYSSSTVEQTCLPVWEAAFITFEWSVSVGEFEGS